jgi:hypothetical protein
MTNKPKLHLTLHRIQTAKDWVTIINDPLVVFLPPRHFKLANLSLETKHHP